jgi:hypothetical protein
MNKPYCNQIYVTCDLCSKAINSTHDCKGQSTAHHPDLPGNNKTGGLNMIPVYDYEGEIIAEVEYNSNLDFWDGRNWTNGGTGRHSGLTQLSDGRYVLIHGTQWQGERDTAEIITPEQAIQEIMRSGNMELFDRFPELRELKEKTIIREREKATA